MGKSRYDETGMFWNDVYSIQGRHGGKQMERIRARPPIPDTGWTAPDVLPDLTREKILCVDVETRDEGLNAKLGPGQYRGDGYIVGIAVGTIDRQWYFPIRHEGSSHNMDEQQVIRWARDLARKPREYIGTNIKYDLEWLAVDGIHLQGQFHDIQIAEPLIDETQLFYSLEAQAQKYLQEGKEDDLLYRWLAMAFGGQPTRQAQAGNIWRAPVELAGPYAMSDVRLPFLIFEQQKKQLDSQQLWGIYELERSLIPMLVAMRQYGVSVDVSRAEQVAVAMEQYRVEAQGYLDSMAGFAVNVDAAQSLARLFDKYALPYNMTGKGNPSFPKKWLESHPHNIAKAILQVRKWARAKGTFVDSYTLKYPIDGIIHAEFNQLKSDDAGTVARFSSSNPNLQNIPKRDKQLRDLVRSLFIPREGCRWRRYDWSQIEFRLITNYGRGEAAAQARRKYNNDPSTDYHNMVMEMTGLERDPAKTINFGLAYGMKEKTLALQMGMSVEGVQPLLELYNRSVPWVSDLFDYVQRVARERGYIKTLLGRRAHFNLWESRDWNTKMEDGAMPYDKAVEKYGQRGIIRADTRKGMSRVIQGGAADIMKKAMMDIWQSGVCDVIGPPHVTVHDELGFSDEQTAQSEEAFAEVKHIMETCVKLKVPLIAECEVGPNWGTLKPL